jgi:1-acyl-sn-glycerol-3-phosphate acyltransferase
MLCALLRVKVREIGAPVRNHPVLIVSNHASWLDIIVIASIAPVAYVAKREVRGWPLVGAAARAEGAVFIDRDRRQNAGEASADIAARLTEGRPVLLFAEGTSSDGNRVLPFRSALLGAANAALARLTPEQRLFVQPLSICYTRQHGMPMGRLHRPLAAWYGDLDFMPHLKDLIRHGAIDVVLTWGEPLPYTDDSDRKAVAKLLEQSIRHTTAQTLRASPAA